MNAANRPCEKILGGVGYLAILGLAFYFTSSWQPLHPAYLLVLALMVLGLGLAMALSRTMQAEAALLAGTALLFGAGLVGYAASKYLFNLSWMESLCFPLGALMAFLGLVALRQRGGGTLSAWILAGFYAGGLAVALRLNGVAGGLFYGLGLLPGFFFGRYFGEVEKKLWVKGLGFAALLIAGRAALQFYLVDSGYASVGVVITHPYTFLALFLGLALPWFYRELDAEKLLPTILTLILLGALLPLGLGIFIHVRAMGAYMMGLIFSTFVLGAVYSGTVSLAWLAYLNLLVVNVALALYRDLGKLSRVARLEILGGVLLLMVILFLVASRRNPGSVGREA